MAPTTCFVVQGRCPGLLGASQAAPNRLAHVFAEKEPSNFTADPGLWRFDFQRPASGTWRQGIVVLNASLTTSCRSADRAWLIRQGQPDPFFQSRPPSDRRKDSAGAASLPRDSNSVNCAGVGNADAAAEEVLRAGRPSGLADLVFSTDTSRADGRTGLPQRELLQLLDSSKFPPAFALNRAASGSGEVRQQPPLGALALLESGLRCRGPTQVFHDLTTGDGQERAPLSAAWARPAPLDQLQAACLASVAAALVHLPRVWGEHGQAMSGVWMRSLSASFHLGSSAQLPAQQPQAQPQQPQCAGSPASSSPGVATMARASGLPTVCASNSQTAGRRTIAAILPPAALALAAAPCSGGAGYSGVVVDGAKLLPATVERTDSGLYGGYEGASSSASRSAGAEVSVGCVSSGSGGAMLQPAPSRTGASQPAAHATASQKDATTAAETEAEKSKVFGNPIRYCKLLFAGAMSAVVSRTCVAPLERVKMDLLLKNGTGDAFTTAAQVLRTEGIGGFWKGNALNVLRTAPFKAVNFFSFDMYRSAFLALSGREENIERFLAGACAGVTATLVCFPLDVVRTRLMASVAGPRYGTGPFTTLAGILRNEGAAALYSGCLPAVIGMAPAGAVFYGVYDLLKHRHLTEAQAAHGQETAVTGASNTAVEASAATATAQQAPTLEPMYTLLYGAMAGAASELIVYPLEVIRRKMQLQSMALASMRQVGSMHPHHSHHHLFAPESLRASAAAAAGGPLAAAAHHHHHHHHHMLPSHLGARRLLATWSAAAVARSPGLARVAAAVSAILTTDGPRGFYSGLLPNILQVLPSAALSYYTYDTLKTMLGAQ